MALKANASNLCQDCLRGQVNLSEEVQAVQPVIQCKQCKRWQAKNKHVRSPLMHEIDNGFSSCSNKKAY